MKIKTSLFLLSAVFIMLIAIIGSMLFFVFSQINKELADSQSVNQIVREVFELNIITDEYLAHHEERMEQQWQLQYSSLSKPLEDLREKELLPEERLILETITTEHKELSSLFLQLQDNFANRQKLTRENRPQSEIDINLDLEERLATQSAMTSQKIKTEAFELSIITEQKIIQVQRRAGLIVLFSIIGFAILSSFISFITIRAITNPIDKLMEAIEIISKGNLRHKADIKTKNEIGQLSRAFDQMTGNLERVTASRDDLNKEITERIKAEEELKNTMDELMAFSYSVSHDLRAPLRSIDGFSQAILEDYDGKLDKQGMHYLRRLRNASQRMGKLIDDLLNLSRVTRGNMEYSKVNLSEMAVQILAELQSSDPEHQVEVRIRKGLTAYGDSRLLRIVLENLLGNAWKFSSKKAKAIIEFGVDTAKGGRVFYVRDNGAGFDMEYSTKMFNPFQRLHAEQEFPGTGIGLASVLRIIRRHEGKVWAEGKVGKGATVYFTLLTTGIHKQKAKTERLSKVSTTKKI